VKSTANRPDQRSRPGSQAWELPAYGTTTVAARGPADGPVSGFAGACGSPADNAVTALDRFDAGRIERGGRFDGAVVQAVMAAASGHRSSVAAIPTSISLSERETDVLRRISLGDSNKEVARALNISPSTVRTHVESTFRKLGCSTRAAATLKASTMGLL